MAGFKRLVPVLCVVVGFFIFLEPTTIAAQEQADDPIPAELSDDIIPAIDHEDAEVSLAVSQASAWRLRNRAANVLQKSIILPGVGIRGGKEAGFRNFLLTSLDRSDTLRATLHQSNANHYLSLIHI